MRSVRTNSAVFHSVVLAVLVLLPAASATGQRLVAARVGVPSVASSSLRYATVLPLSQPSSLMVPGPLGPRAGDEKDPLIAGLLSWVIPGVGSFYAGNNTHGWTHLIIDVASYGVIIGGATATGSTGTVAMGVGFVSLFVNDIWSIFTAVSDAQATRRSSGRTGSSGGLDESATKNQHETR